MSALDLSHLDAAETEAVGKLEMAINRCQSHKDPEWPLRDIEGLLADHEAARVLVRNRRHHRIGSPSYQSKLGRALGVLTEEVEA